MQEKSAGSGPLDGSTGDCLSDDDLAAVAGRALSAGERQRIDRHLDVCGSCRRAVSAMAAAIEGGSVTDGEPVHAPGERLGRFTLVRPLGRGAMGEVWAARDPELDREVAIKLLRLRAESLGDDPTARLRREAQAMARLNHANVVKIFELGADGDQVFCAMELVDGVTLRGWMDEPRTWREVIQVALAVGRGLAAAHAAGLVHRDVKPDNVLIARDGRVLVTDFGLAKLSDQAGWSEMDGSGPHGQAEPPAGTPEYAAFVAMAETARPVHLTRTGIVVGTPAYMPPEQLEGKRVDAASDQYSYCVTVYEALFGARPFNGATVTELASAARAGLRRLPSGRDVPGRIGRCLARGLSPDPDQRWPSMQALLGAIERAAGRRRRRFAAAIGAVAAVVAAALFLGLGGDRTAEVRADAESRIARAWNDERRAELTRHLISTGAPTAAELAAATADALDRLRDDWMAMRLDAWAATNLRGEQSADLLERRVACLDRAADELTAMVDVLLTLDRGEAVRAPQAAHGLHPLSMCADRERLLAESTPTDTPERRALAAEQREQEVLVLAGRHGEALARARRAAARLEGHPDVSLVARAVHDLGDAQARAGDLAGAEASLRRAVQDAARARDHRLVAEGWNRLVALIGQDQGRPRDAIALEPAARAAVAQAGDDPAQRAALEGALGRLQLALGRAAAARDHFIAARDRLVAARGPEHPEVAGAEADLAAAHEELDQPEDAARSLDRALAILRGAYGERHPEVARAHADHAALAGVRGDQASSERHARAAVAIYQAALGAARPETANARVALAGALRSQGRLAEARAELDHARAALAAASPPTQLDLARLILERARLAAAEGDHAEGERLGRDALASLRASLPPGHPELQRRLAELARMIGRRSPAEALDLYDEALRGAKSGRREGAVDAALLAELGECALAARLPGRALAWFDEMPEASRGLGDLRARLAQAARVPAASAASTRRHAGR